MSVPRIAITGLVMSASAMVALIVQEGYTERAVIPVKNDVPTLGHGSTTHADGKPVRIGDTTTPTKAIQRTLQYVQMQDAQIRQCVTAPLHQGEYDVMADFAYQFGIKRLCDSSMVKLANAGDYTGSCNAYLSYRFQGADKFDCSTMIDGKRNKRCYGVWTRQQSRYYACLELQQ